MTIIEVSRQLALSALVIVLALGGAGLVVILGASIPATLVGLLATSSYYAVAYHSCRHSTAHAGSRCCAICFPSRSP